MCRREAAAVMRSSEAPALRSRVECMTVRSVLPTICAARSWTRSIVVRGTGRFPVARESSPASSLNSGSARPGGTSESAGPGAGGDVDGGRGGGCLRAQEALVGRLRVIRIGFLFL